jgi:POT family proton-dependent oligopeptide transporter
LSTLGARADTDIMGHPRGLTILFFTEMWERFSYYGMRALLILYLTDHFLFTDTPAYSIFASYTALVYITPVLGGMIADRYIGFRRAIWYGGIMIMFGHIGMAFEGAEATLGTDGAVMQDEFSLQVLYLSLAFIVVGTGLLKASISSVVGNLYGEGDGRRDGGFTIFYMGINIGAFAAPLLCGYLAAQYGWSWGFGAAAVGMAAGLVVFHYGHQWLDGHGEAPDPAALNEPVLGGLTKSHFIAVACVLSIIPIWWLVQSGEVVGDLLTAIGGVLVLGVVGYAIKYLEPVERDRIFAILLLVPASILFWAFFEQTGSSIALFAKRGVDLQLLGVTVAPAQIQSINPLLIITLAPVFGMLWVWLNKRGWDPSLPVKFALALVQMGLGFYMFYLGIESAGAGQKVAFVWLVLGFFFHTTGELCLSPVGLSAVTKLSVPKIMGLMMGIWFLAAAFANYAAGLIAMTASIDGVPGENVAVEVALPLYGNLFESVAIAAIVSGIIMFAVSPFVRRLMHGVK